MKRQFIFYRVLTGFVAMVNEFPIMNIHNEMYSQNLEQIRAKYKQVTLFIVYI